MRNAKRLFAQANGKWPFPKSPFALKHWKWLRLGILTSIDATAVAVCYWGAFLLRLDTTDLGPFAEVFARTLSTVVAAHLAGFFAGGMYRQVWRFANINSAVLIVRCIGFGSVLSAILIVITGTERLPPRSVGVIYVLLATAVLTIIRFSWRLVANAQSKSSDPTPKERCFIYGAGSAGELLARHVVADSNFPYKVLGFIDDDRNKAGRLLHGFKIFGPGRSLAELSAHHSVRTVILALPSAPGKVVRDVVSRCHEAGLKPLIMPEIAHALGTDPVQPRAVDVKDLLRRSPKSIDMNRIGAFLRGHTVMITGAGGSIGSELARQVAAFDPRKLILFDASEHNLYRIDQELRDLGIKEDCLHAVLGSATEPRVVERVFREHRPTCILHAAAYKHVTLVENNPAEGIVNNVLGAKTVAEAAVHFGAEHFLLISTDKAVRPTSVMGATKRCCELIVQALHSLNPGKCRFSVVRFGNVLGSSGSVIPRFLDQIQAGGPVTVTHPDVERFFMLIPEAVGLCLQTITMAQGGEVFVLNMGPPVKICEMARQLIVLAGKEPGRDIDIVFSGLKPGEKLYEELILEGREIPTVHEDVFIATPQPIDSHFVLAKVDQILLAAYHGNEALCRQSLWSLLKDDDQGQANWVPPGQVPLEAIRPVLSF